MLTSKLQAIAGDLEAVTVEPAVAAFVCANCARLGRKPSSAVKARPATPTFSWPFAVREVVIPCAGRLQPEHLLRAFEAGADAVCVIACELDNCHTQEGSRRCRVRIEYLRGLLEQVGLGSSRLLFHYLPGSANEDMALGLTDSAGHPGSASPQVDSQVRAIRDEVIARIAGLPPNPLRVDGRARAITYELDQDDESDD
jgi:F420-non-reducing hydrogenase iron-sulfur subunit